MEANRIKTLQTTMPRGAPLDTATLAGLGISAALAHEYVKAGWLEKLGRGVFMFAGDELQRNETILWGDHRTDLPSWFQDRFPARYSSSRLFDDELPAGTGIAPMPEFPNGPRVSGPERALLEMLSEVGVYQELEEARAIMENVRQLRTRQLSLLLNHCRMVKAIRLCVAWARELDLPWAGHARDAASDRMGSGRWIGRLKNGNTLILKPE
jgi:hypothetical protein